MSKQHGQAVGERQNRAISPGDCSRAAVKTNAWDRVKGKRRVLWLKSGAPKKRPRRSSITCLLRPGLVPGEAAAVERKVALLPAALAHLLLVDPARLVREPRQDALLYHLVAVVRDRPGRAEECGWGEVVVAVVVVVGVCGKGGRGGGGARPPSLDGGLTSKCTSSRRSRSCQGPPALPRLPRAPWPSESGAVAGQSVSWSVLARRGLYSAAWRRKRARAVGRSQREVGRRGGQRRLRRGAAWAGQRSGLGRPRGVGTNEASTSERASEREIAGLTPLLSLSPTHPPVSVPSCVSPSLRPSVALSAPSGPCC